MQVDYENIQGYIYFLIEKYAPHHYEPVCTICKYEQTVQGSSIIRLLTFVLAYFEKNHVQASAITRAINELLMNCYEKGIEI